MACIVYQTNKKTGVQYAYQSESYRDPITKKPTSRRIYLGRVDPETKSIIQKAETGKRNRSKIGAPSAESTIESKKYMKQIQELQDQVESLQKQVVEMAALNKQYVVAIRKITHAASNLPL